MIDLHTHILPNIDDGPLKFEESLEMATMACDSGIELMVATPHIKPGVYCPSKATILQKVFELNSRLQSSSAESIVSANFRILPGSEIHIDPMLLSQLDDGELLTINDNHKYFFLELPDYFLFPQVKKLISDLCSKGFIPIISHPERNSQLQKNLDLVADLIEEGALFQITAMSLTGEFGSQAKDCSEIMIVSKLAQIIASDAHSKTWRPPILTRAVEAAAKLIGLEEAERMVTTVPRAVIAGEDVDFPEYKRKKKTF